MVPSRNAILCIVLCILCIVNSSRDTSVSLDTTLGISSNFSSWHDFGESTIDASNAETDDVRRGNWSLAHTTLGITFNFPLYFAAGVIFLLDLCAWRRLIDLPRLRLAECGTVCVAFASSVKDNRCCNGSTTAPLASGCTLDISRCPDVL